MWRCGRKYIGWLLLAVAAGAFIAAVFPGWFVACFLGAALVAACVLLIRCRL